jgi:hypothetical protein
MCAWLVGILWARLVTMRRRGFNLAQASVGGIRQPWIDAAGPNSPGWISFLALCFLVRALVRAPRLHREQISWLDRGGCVRERMVGNAECWFGRPRADIKGITW